MELEPKQLETDKEGVSETSKGSKICCSDLTVILNYMIAETKKKVSALRIGIFTVFMVVMVIVMLKSVVQITPILFVKLGQV